MRARESILWTAIIYRVKHCAIIVEAQRKLFTFEHSKSRLNGFGSYFPCQIHSHFSYINRYGSWNRSAYCYYYYYQHCVCVCACCIWKAKTCDGKIDIWYSVCFCDMECDVNGKYLLFCIHRLNIHTFNEWFIFDCHVCIWLFCLFFQYPSIW